MRPRRRITGIVIFVVVMAIKAYFLAQFAYSDYAHQAVDTITGDGGHYLRIAKNIAGYGAYSDNQSVVPTESATWRPPIWPAILAIFYLISDNLVVLLALRMALETAIGFWALSQLKNHFNLGERLYYLLFLVLLEPQFIKYDTTFLTESLTAVLLFTLAVAFLTTLGKKVHPIFPFLCATVVLCHPVSVFCVLTLFSIYIWKAGRKHIRQSIAATAIFIVLLAAWPVRNALTFGKGIYLTASHGTTFSKGWNDSVAANFTNTTGDDANEYDNLKYLPSQQFPESPVSMSKIFTSATGAFISQASVSELAAIAVRKLSANFNPLRETPKAGFLEKLGSAVRILYLCNFVALAVFAFKFRKKASVLQRNVFAVVAAILIGQMAMAVYIYTGLRFNSIYGMTSLLCLMLLAAEFIGRRRQQRKNG